MENNWDFDCTLKINPELLTAYNETNLIFQNRDKG